MPVSPDKLIENLKRGKPLSAIVLLGTDVYLRDLCRNKIIEATVPEASRDWAVTRMSARESSWDEVLQRAETMPMLAPRQVVIVEASESIERLGDAARDPILKALDSYFQSPAPFTLLVLEAGELDGRLKFSKLLHEKTLVVELTIGSESAVALAEHMAHELGAAIERQAAALLADSLNGEPARMSIELEKLATYVNRERPISAADIEALVVAARKNTVWQLTEMLSSRRRAHALAFLDNLLREGEQPVAIIGALAWAYRKLIEARSLPARTQGFQAARTLGMAPQSTEAAVRNAHRVSKEALLAGLRALAEADSQLKSSNPDPHAAMEFLIARLTAPDAGAARAS